MSSPASVPIQSTAAAIQAISEALAALGPSLPAERRGSFDETVQRLRSYRVELLAWLDENR